ncbi:hypothetical protein BHE74_00014360 [Ensete ventricosum]|nr:hypothetical protein BHE74_00014360 [Ensete ventricosum]
MFLLPTRGDVSSPRMGRCFFSPLLPEKPAQGEETISRSLGNKLARPAKPGDVVKAYSPASPRLLLPAGDISGSSRESGVGSPGSPSSSFSLG